MTVATTANSDTLARNAIRTTVISLLIDLLAFTLPLPLFPRLVEGYIRDDKLRGPSSGVSAVGGLWAEDFTKTPSAARPSALPSIQPG